MQMNVNQQNMIKSMMWSKRIPNVACNWTRMQLKGRVNSVKTVAGRHEHLQIVYLDGGLAGALEVSRMPAVARFTSLSPGSKTTQA